jgi:hypothetical protein
MEKTGNKKCFDYGLGEASAHSSSMLIVWEPVRFSLSGYAELLLDTRGGCQERLCCPLKNRPSLSGELSSTPSGAGSGCSGSLPGTPGVLLVRRSVSRCALPVPVETTLVHYSGPPTLGHLTGTPFWYTTWFNAYLALGAVLASLLEHRLGALVGTGWLITTGCTRFAGQRLVTRPATVHHLAHWVPSRLAPGELLGTPPECRLHELLGALLGAMLGSTSWKATCAPFGLPFGLALLVHRCAQALPLTTGLALDNRLAHHWSQRLVRTRRSTGISLEHGLVRWLAPLAAGFAGWRTGFAAGLGGWRTRIRHRLTTLAQLGSSARSGAR